MLPETWRLAWRETVARKGHTLVTVVSYSLAVGLMIVLISVLSFSRDSSATVLSGTGTSFIAYLPLCQNQTCSIQPIDKVNEGFLANGNPSKPIAADVIPKIRQLKTVSDASPMLVFKFYQPALGGAVIVGGMDMTNPSAFATISCATTDVVHGRFITSQDHGKVMLEQTFAGAFGLSEGSTVNVAGQTFNVIGIVNTQIRPDKANIYLPIEEAREIINTRLVTPITTEINVIFIQSASAPQHAQALQDVQKIIGDSGLITSYACYAPVANSMGINDKGVWVATILAGLSVIALSLRIQYASVIERRYDIGILKAIGWSDGQIVSQVLSESIIKAAIGGLAGALIALVVILAVPVKLLSGIDTTATLSIPPSIVAAGIALALTAGVISGVFPAWIAARLNPATSLRRM